MFKLIQRLTKKKTNKKVYSLPMGHRVVSFADIETAAILHSIWHTMTEYVIKINN